MRLNFFILLLPGLLLGCKKDKDKSNGDQLVRSISDGVSTAQILSYDGQKRLVRVDYNAAVSLRFEYSGAGVLVQQYDGANNPIATNRYDFTIINNRIINLNRYRANNVIDKYYFEYDNQQRMSQLFISETFNGSEQGQHRYWFSYDAQNNVQSIAFRRKIQGENSDSIYISKTYYETKSFLQWKDIGFDYFGTAAIGQEHLGYGIIVPLHVVSHYYPSNNALKSVSENDFNWNPVNSTWLPSSSNNYTRDETVYEYDQDGRLIGYGGDTIEWE